MRMFDIEKQHLASQVGSIFKNKILTEINSTLTDSTVPKRDWERLISPRKSKYSVGNELYVWFGKISGTEIVREQCFDHGVIILNRNNNS